MSFKKEIKRRHLDQEKIRVGKVSQIRELIFGAQDGLLVPLGVVTSVAGAFNNNHIVIVAGIAEALAGAFSMGTGAYLASQAEKQVHDAEVEKERLVITQNPEEEKKEMALLFEKEGVAEADAKNISLTLSKYKNSFLITMTQKEFGVDPEPVKTASKDAIYVGASYILAAFVPLFPYFFVTGKEAIVFSILATLIALFVIGVMKGIVASLPFLKSGFQVMAVGAAAGLGGYFLGTLLPSLLHIH